jgi:hypothetical protein
MGACGERAKIGGHWLYVREGEVHEMSQGEHSAVMGAVLDRGPMAADSVEDFNVGVPIPGQACDRGGINKGQ